MVEMDQYIEKKSGFSKEDAFAIDEVNLYEKLGEDAFWKLSNVFYDKVFNDERAWFRNIFKTSNQKEATQNQVEFFIQRMGGPPKYSKRKGHPALIGRHLKFNMAEKAAKRWLELMEQSLNEVIEIDEDSKNRMIKYFAHTAYFLSFGVSRSQRNN